MFRQLGCHPQETELHKNMIIIVSLFCNEYASSKCLLLHTIQRIVHGNKVHIGVQK